MTISAQEPDKPLHWYRQLWPWYIIGLLLFGVLGSGVLVVSSIEHPDPLVVDNYYKEGLAINRTLDRQRRAAALGLVAIVQFDKANDALGIRLQASKKIQADTLTLRFVHATLANRDYSVVLHRISGNDYRARLSALRAGNYNLLLEPDSRVWRLDAHLELPANSWSMKPEP